MNFKLNRYSFSITILFFSVIALAQKNDSIQLRKIYDFYLTESKCYSNLEHLCKKIGPRLSGSKGAEDAVAWAKKAMYEAGADTVILQPCMVPHWVRGKAEQCQLIEKNKSTKLNVTALGSSVGTGEKGIKASIIEVKNFEELEKLGEKNIKGKIVFYNVFFNQAHVKTGSAYGETVKFRSKGASYAAKYGAVATLVRSMTSLADDEPHTGNMNYDTSVSKIKIPSLALSYVAADKLSQAIKNDPTT